jgi:hypothetical protein
VCECSSGRRKRSSLGHHTVEEVVEPMTKAKRTLVWEGREGAPRPTQLALGGFKVEMHGGWSISVTSPLGMDDVRQWATAMGWSMSGRRMIGVRRFRDGAPRSTLR